MGILELEKKLNMLSLECDNDSIFSASAIPSFEVVEQSPFCLDMEIAGGSRPRSCIMMDA